MLDLRPVPVRIDEAFGALQRGDLDQAQAGFQTLRDTEPTLPAAYLGLAEVAARRNDPAAAEASLRQGLAALTAGADPAPFHRALGRLHAERNEPDQVAAEFRLAMTRPADAVRSALEAADLLNQKLGRPKLALPFYDQVLAAEPGHAMAHYGRALALARAAPAGPPPPEALAELDTARRLDPTNVLPPFAAAQLLLRAGNPEAARAALDATLAQKPDFLQARLTRANLLLALGRYQDSAADFTDALAREPTLAAAYAGLGMAQTAAGHPAAAEDAYRQALRLNPRQPLVLNNLAALLTDGRRALDEALAAAQAANDQMPDQPAFLDTLGWVQFARGDLTQASRTLQRALALAQTPETLTRLGQVQLALGNRTDAASRFRSALALQPGYAPAQQAIRQLR